MEIDFTQQLIRLDNGEPLDIAIAACPMCRREVESKPATLRAICVDALLNQYEAERNLSGEEKMTRFNLAVRITNEDEPELRSEEVTLIKKVVAMMYGPLVMGQTWNMLDPQET